MSTGSRITQARREKGWSQAKLAEAVGVEPPSVSRWESDSNEPAPENLKAISEKLGCSVAWLLGEPHEAAAPDGLSERLAALEQLAYPGVAEELARLRQENQALRAKLDGANAVVQAAWPTADERIQVVCLFFLTGERAYIRHLSRDVASKVEVLTRALGKVGPKSRA